MILLILARFCLLKKFNFFQINRWTNHFILHGPLHHKTHTALSKLQCLRLIPKRHCCVSHSQVFTVECEGISKVIFYVSFMPHVCPYPNILEYSWQSWRPFHSITFMMPGEARLSGGGGVKETVTSSLSNRYDISPMMLQINITSYFKQCSERLWASDLWQKSQAMLPHLNDAIKRESIHSEIKGNFRSRTVFIYAV